MSRIRLAWLAGVLLLAGAAPALAGAAGTEPVPTDAAPAAEDGSAVEPAAAAEPAAAVDASGEETPLPSPTPLPPAHVPDALAPKRVLDADSGVAVQTLCTNCNNADLSLGGLGDDHVEVVCDGVPVPPGLARIYLLSVMPQSAIDKVAVVRGAGDPALGGGAVAGGILITRRPPARGFSINGSADSGSYGWRGTQIDLSGGSERVGGWLLGSWSRSDTINSNQDGIAQEDIPELYTVPEGLPATAGFKNELPSFRRYTVEGGVDVRPTSHHRLRIGGATYDESQKDGPGAYDAFFSGQAGLNLYNRENVELERQQANLRYDWLERGGGHLSVTGSWVERSQDVFETEFVNALLSPTYLVDERRLHGALDFGHPVGQRMTMNFGGSTSEGRFDIVDVAFNSFGLSLPYEQALTFALQETVTETAFWSVAEATLTPRLRLSGGLRHVDYRYEDDETRPQWLAFELPEGDRLLPRAALSYRPADAWELRWSAGAGFRVPEPIYDEVCCGRRYRNNRGVAPERSRSYGFETIWQPGPHYKVTGSAFLTDFRDLVLKMATLSFQQRPTYQHVNVPEARFLTLGVETSVEPARWVTVKAGVTWLDPENRTAGDAIPALIDFFSTPVIKTFVSEDVPYRARRRGTVGLRFRPFRGVDLGVFAQHTGSMLIQRYDPLVIDPELGSDLQPEFFETDPFWVVNADVSKTFRHGLSLYAGVDNLGDEVQPYLGQPEFEFDWGALRGRYYYGGLRVRFAD